MTVSKINYARVHEFAMDHNVDYNALCKMVRDAVSLNDSVSTKPVKDCNPEQTQKIMTWQPIKTAPRDGTNILIAFGRDGVSQAKYVPGLPNHPWQFLDTNDGITWLVNYAKDGLGGPSHWKSLPQWPECAMKGGSGFGSTPTAPARDGSEPCEMCGKPAQKRWCDTCLGVSVKRSEWESLSPEAQQRLLRSISGGVTRIEQVRRAQAAVDVADKPLTAPPERSDVQDSKS